jgi:kinesin family protein 2/24
MLACICPGSSSAEHTLNTLRYAERLKERGPNGPVY